MTTTVNKTTARAIVRATLAVRELAAALEAAERELQEIEAEARAAGFIGCDCMLKGTLYVITTSRTQKFSISADDSALVEFAKRHGLKTTPPKPESCSSATIRAAALRGIDVSSVCDVTTNEVYAVSVH
jgi:hypothetical protein